ncbi:hypothetical protein LTR16_002113 [Cryomyces antarcticus]|uniref:Uncharacterized protein n=1 Tax=Cryomyces antarcticus TaxID=329879 RepID=A0ABR0M0H6_9PEZI|nr:hypothetical protein LTR16_002113 [Cryomyces antarcticus]
MGDAGVTGSDGIPGATSTVPSSPSTLQASAPASGTTSADCASTDTGDECCARLGGGNVQCGVTSAGTYTTFHCYDPSAGEECCSNLERCIGAGCCETLGVGVSVPFSSYSSSAAAVATPPSSLASGYLSTLSSTSFFRPASTATQVSTLTGGGTQVPVAGTSGTSRAASVSAPSVATSRNSSTTTTTSGSSSTASLPTQQTANVASGGAGVEGVVAVLVGVAGLVGLLRWPATCSFVGVSASASV